MARPRKKEQRSIYNRLRVLRAETDLSRADLAERVGVNPQTIGAIERGDHYPSLDLAMSLCEIFALPIEAVFNREPLTYSPDTYTIQRATSGTDSAQHEKHREEERTGSA